MKTQYLSCLLSLVFAAVSQGEMQLQWKLELPAREVAWSHTSRMRRDVAYPLAVHGKMLLIGCEHNRALLPVDLATGQEQWRFYTGAPIRVAPESDGKRVFVSSDDGCLYEYADAANSLSSDETIARAPLGLLWYEGPAGDARFYFDGHVDHQSGHSVSPLPPGALILDGRMILQGPGRLGAFDIYTGRLLWEAELPEVYGFGGLDGGLGIHSRKHREPWRYEPALGPVSQLA